MDTAVLVLNLNYEPLNVCEARRALVLVDLGKAEVLEHNGAVLRSARRVFVCPSVIRLAYLVRRPRPQTRLSRREIFVRDDYTCQYCGAHMRELTLDHVVPLHRGGAHTWENLVSACPRCNHRKGGRSPEEAHIRLLRQPVRPRASFLSTFYHHLQTHEEWLKFVPEWEVSFLPGGLPQSPRSTACG